jgi:hypothetical protein
MREDMTTVRAHLTVVGTKLTMLTGQLEDLQVSLDAVDRRTEAILEALRGGRSGRDPELPGWVNGEREEF